MGTVRCSTQPRYFVGTLLHGDERPRGQQSTHSKFLFCAAGIFFCVARRRGQQDLRAAAGLKSDESPRDVRGRQRARAPSRTNRFGPQTLNPSLLISAHYPRQARANTRSQVILSSGLGDHESRNRMPTDRRYRHPF